MSDLSQPPLSLVPMGTEGLMAPPSPTGQPAAGVGTLAWPAPPSISHMAPPPLAEPEPCELEGPNGKINAGQLLNLDVEAGQVQVLIPPSRNPLTLRFSQFRRLSLTRPLEPMPAVIGARMDDTTPLLPQNLLQPYRLLFKDGTETVLSSVGLIDRPQGLFTFRPIDASGRLLRSLYPRPLLVAVELAPISALADNDQPTAPMGLDELTTVKYVVRGSGQIR